MKNMIRMFGILFRRMPCFVVMTIFVKILEGIPDIINILIIRHVIDLIYSGSNIKPILTVTAVRIGIVILIAMLRNWYYEHYRLLKVNEFESASKEEFFNKVLQMDLAYQESSQYFEQYIRAGAEIVLRPLSMLDSVLLISQSIISNNRHYFNYYCIRRRVACLCFCRLFASNCHNSL